MICSTDGRSAPGHFATEQAAMKSLDLVTRSWTHRDRPRLMRWKPVINAFAITFGDRWAGAETRPSGPQTL
jgi:transposase-like protein